MKRTLFALSMLALVLSPLPRANGAEFSVGLFYDNLSGGGWIDADDYGYGWQPDVAANDPDWRPYADGYWAYTDYGWTWVSYEDFGWATYHYGRWAKLADYGWVWFPGSDLEWGPAWVSWRFGGSYCGWAPLPPRGPGIVYEGRPIGGHVDIEFDIGPAYYNFVDIRYIGEPVLRSRIYASSYNVTYVNQTVNVTNITVKNNVVYNYGPDYDVVSRHSERPVQRLKIERETNVDVSAAAKSGRMTKVQGDKLMIGAPLQIRKPAKEVAPPTVKTKIGRDKVKMERGWGVAGDEKAQTELKQKIKAQDLKRIPPPTAAGAEIPGAGSPAPSITPLGTAAPESSASPMEKGKRQGKFGQPSPEPAASTDPFEKGKNRFERGKPGKPGPMGSPEAAPGTEGSPIATPVVPEKGKGKGRFGERVGPMPSPNREMSPSGVGEDQMKGKGRKNFERGKPIIAPSPTETSNERNLNSSKSNLYKSMSPVPSDTSTENSPIGKARGRFKTIERPTGQTSPIETDQGPGRGKFKKQMGGPPTVPEPMNPPGSTSMQDTGNQPKGKHSEGAVARPGGAPTDTGEGRPQGKKKHENESPSPVPPQ